MIFLYVGSFFLHSNFHTVPNSIFFKQHMHEMYSMSHSGTDMYIMLHLHYAELISWLVKQDLNLMKWRGKRSTK